LVFVAAVNVWTTAYMTSELFVRVTRTVHADPPAGRPAPRKNALQLPASVAVSTARPPVTAGTFVLTPAGLIATLVAVSVALDALKT
jgi:hypothetical protein